jgi:protein tyrosine phosphatase (PTP) superfamily phosphohydrolase (DUF442 family)
MCFDSRYSIIATLALGIAGCQSKSVAPAPSPAAAEQPGTQSAVATVPSTNTPEKLDVKFLPNAYRIHAKVISGGQPDGDQAFRELAEMGVKTVISVDGAQPDVAAAKKHGLRYVHLPHGYDGVPDSRVKELAKAVRDLPGPIYIHCHHGKHRSPAAASVACVSAGLLDPTLAVAVLKTAGTSDGYRGLYASASEARRLDDKLLDELDAEFPESARIPPLAEAMVAMERTHDRMKSIAAAGWRTPSDHPDLAPAHEALLLREHYSELLRSEVIRAEPTAFRMLLREGESAAKELEEALNPSNVALERARVAIEQINKNCTDCHKAYRDIPLREKSTDV